MQRCQCPFYNGTLETWIWKKYVEDIVVFLTRKVLILISPSLLIRMSHWQKTTNEKQFKETKTWISIVHIWSDNAFKGTVASRASPTLLEIKRTAHWRKCKWWNLVPSRSSWTAYCRFSWTTSLVAPGKVEEKWFNYVYTVQLHIFSFIKSGPKIFTVLVYAVNLKMIKVKTLNLRQRTRQDDCTAFSLSVSFYL